MTTLDVRTCPGRKRTRFSRECFILIMLQLLFKWLFVQKLPEYIHVADSVFGLGESASQSFLRLYASTSLFLMFFKVGSSFALASRAVINISYSAGRPHSNRVATC